MNPNCSLGALPEKILDEIDDYINKQSEESGDLPLETFRRTLFWKGKEFVFDRSSCGPELHQFLVAVDVKTLSEIFFAVPIF